MKHLSPVLMLSCAAMFAVHGIAADSPGTLAETKSTSTISPASPVPTPSERPRLISTGTAERLAAVSPKFEPSTAMPPAPAGNSAIDTPRNQIVRLPDYIVREPRAPSFPERRILTPKGRLEVALKRFPGLRFGNIWFLRNDGIALFMLEEEYRLERMAEMADLASLVRISDPAAGATLKSDMQQSSLRDRLSR
ncbi:MAG: hypothetical protein ABIZ49_13850 [Opitutaceae bacterium]